MSDYHIPVMPKESIELLKVLPGHWYVDCNLGGGGHTSEILKAGGKVIGIDLDPDAIYEVAKNHGLKVEDRNYHLQAFSEKLILYQSNFANIDEVVKAINNSTSERLDNRTISGIFFDLGVSTYQLEEGSRGFSFNKDAPLDMRMNPTHGASAKDLVNGLYEKELAELFWKFGEENFARPIARKIVEYRKSKLIETTDELAKIVLSVRRRNPADRTHPATRIFQALRIAVNDELNSLREALPKSFDLLEKGGRLVVISFHSLEDRIVKQDFRQWEQAGKGKILTEKPIETSDAEVALNPRSRSAKLRAIENI